MNVATTEYNEQNMATTNIGNKYYLELNAVVDYVVQQLLQRTNLEMVRENLIGLIKLNEFHMKDFVEVTTKWWLFKETCTERHIWISVNIGVNLYLIKDIVMDILKDYDCSMRIKERIIDDVRNRYSSNNLDIEDKVLECVKQTIIPIVEQYFGHFSTLDITSGYEKSIDVKIIQTFITKGISK